ncbi:MAG: GDYXXLXY domain-containing protein [Parvibaculaceae bacterium]
MPRTPRILLAGLLIVALFQSAALAKMVYDRVSLLKTGKEVTLALAPRDPRDFFRGYYSDLNYDISRLDLSKLLSATDTTALRAEPYSCERKIYVGLKQSQSGVFEPVSASLATPAVEPDVVVVRGCVCNAGNITQLWVRYGIESFYLPEEEAAALDLKERDVLRMVAAVGPDGEMAIKRLLVNGQPAYEELPF